jgi:hypothetical protein
MRHAHTSGCDIFLRLNNPNIHLRTDGAELSPDSTQLQIQFAAGTGYVEKIPTLYLVSFPGC